MKTTRNKTTGTVTWGILSTAKIGVEKVIPALQEGRFSTVGAIASRDAGKARLVARKLGIPRAYGSYEDLLSDPDIQSVYISLPNNLHVPWAIRCLEAGKHVLCEKPLGLNANEAAVLERKAAEFPNLRVMEAFMYRFHPQWQLVRDQMRSGVIGTPRWIHSHFLYNNTDPNNIRNRPQTGGGGLLDIGCYCISAIRVLFDGEPIAVRGSMEIDPTLQTDRLFSGVLEFTNGTGSFTCSTQSYPDQGVQIVGTSGRIHMKFPFTPPPEEQTYVEIESGSGKETITFEPCDQYTLQGDAFSKAVLSIQPVPTPLSDAVQNMKVIDMLAQNAHSN